MKDELISKLNSNTYNYGDPGVASNIDDFVNPDFHDIDGMDYRKLLTYNFNNEVNLCNYDLSDNTIDNTNSFLQSSTGSAISCITCNDNCDSNDDLCKFTFCNKKIKYIIIEINDKKDAGTKCDYTKLFK